MSVIRADKWLSTEGSTIGTVLQVAQGIKRDTWSVAGQPTTFYEVAGLSATLTPRSNTSKILVMADVHACSGYWEIQGRLRRNGADIADAQGQARGVRSLCSFLDNRYDGGSNRRYGWGPLSCIYVDSPNTTSATTYTISLNGFSTFSLSVNFNIFDDANNTDYFGQPISTITLMEIAA